MKVIKGEKGKLPYGTYSKKDNKKKYFVYFPKYFLKFKNIFKLHPLNLYID